MSKSKGPFDNVDVLLRCSVDKPKAKESFDAVINILKDLFGKEVKKSPLKDYELLDELANAINRLTNWPKWDQLIEAAEKVDKEDAIHTLKLLAEEWYSTSGEYGEGPNIEANETMKPSVEMMHAFFEALPDKEKK